MKVLNVEIDLHEESGGILVFIILPIMITVITLGIFALMWSYQESQASFLSYVFQSWNWAKVLIISVAPTLFCWFLGKPMTMGMCSVEER